MHSGRGRPKPERNGGEKVQTIRPVGPARGVSRVGRGRGGRLDGRGSGRGHGTRYATNSNEGDKKRPTEKADAFSLRKQMKTEQFRTMAAHVHHRPPYIGRQNVGRGRGGGWIGNRSGRREPKSTPPTVDSDCVCPTCGRSPEVNSEPTPQDDKEDETFTMPFYDKYMHEFDIDDLREEIDPPDYDIQVIDPNTVNIHDMIDSDVNAHNSDTNVNAACQSTDDIEKMDGYMSYRCDVLDGDSVTIAKIDSNSGCIKLNVGDQIESVIIDTGSAFTVASRARLTKLNPEFVRKGEKPKPGECTAIGVDGKRVHFSDVYYVEFTLENRPINIRFLVSNDCQKDLLLLGRDTLADLRAIYHAGDNTLTLPQLPGSVLCATHDIAIPPHTEAVIPLLRPSGIPSGTRFLGIVDRLHMAARKLEPCLDYVDDKHSPSIVCRNDTDKPILLDNKTPLAQFTPLQDYIEDENEHFRGGEDDEKMNLMGAEGTYLGPETMKHNDLVNEDDLFGDFGTESPPENWQYDDSYPQIDMSDSMCTEKEKKIMMEVFKAHRKAFANKKSELSMANVEPLDIDTGASKPIFVHPYPMNAEKRKILQSQIDELVAQGVLRPALTAWRFPCLLVSKKDGSWRLVTDLRRLNAVIESVPAHPLPKLTEFGRDLTADKVAYQSLYDLTSFFHQLPLSKSASEKCTLGGPTGGFSYLRVPMGLASSPIWAHSLLERLMHDLVIAGKIYVYMDA